MPIGLRSRIRKLICLSVLCLAVFVPGCGYRVAGVSVKPPEGIKNLTIQTLSNRTKQQELEQVLTRALIQEFSERSAIKVNSQKSTPDAVLEGEIISFTATPILFSGESYASTFLITIQVNLRLTQDGGKKILFENPNLVFRDQYRINTNQQQYYPELNQALKRIARDFAASVATTVLTGW
jgi:hypothetical protein